MAQITFHGAARTVTGSKYLIESGGENLMIDCGMFQGERRLRRLNWDPPKFDSAGIHHVVITHTHMDHIGYLPRLVRQGYRGKIHATPATRALAKILLEDAAQIHEEDARHHKKYGTSRHEDPEPFFDRKEAEKTWSMFVDEPRGKWIKLSPTFSFRYQSAGHLLGAASIELRITENDKTITMLFSGDVGRYGVPFVRDPVPAVDCDYLVMESTYGSREHAHSDLFGSLAEIVNKCAKRKGILLIPSFAVGRAQQLIYMLRRLTNARRISKMPIFLDSPMAIDATEIYCKYEHDHGIPLEELEGEACILAGPQVKFTPSRDQSKELNNLDGPAILISSSGMLTGGRVLYHVMRLAPDNRNTIMFAGYQAYGTRGRDMLEGKKSIRIYKQDIPVNAEVVDLDGLSGHADASELLRWSSTICAKPRNVFLTHGELESAEALRKTLVERRKWDVTIPELFDTYELTPGETVE